MRKMWIIFLSGSGIVFLVEIALVSSQEIPIALMDLNDDGFVSLPNT